MASCIACGYLIESVAYELASGCAFFEPMRCLASCVARCCLAESADSAGCLHCLRCLRSLVTMFACLSVAVSLPLCLPASLPVALCTHGFYIKKP